MKLIIDIPEDIYQTFHNTQPRMGDEGMDSICQAIGNGIPLDKIRKEIRSMKIFPVVSRDGLFYNAGILDAIEIIDKYKGEQT